jgi:hypothetical protein
LLCTAVIPDTPYDTEILPLTEPLFRRYAERWDMEFIVNRISEQQRAPFKGTSTAPAGTEADYANLPLIKRALREGYGGVVFFDSDAVMVDPSEDISLEVDDEQPIGSVGGLGCLVLKNSELSRAFIDTIWAMRHAYLNKQWLEQACALHLLGFDPEYPGDNQPPRYIGPTAWTPYVREIPHKWNHHPLRDPIDYRVLHPTGVQPFSRRLQYIQRAAALANTPGL